MFLKNTINKQSYILYYILYYTYICKQDRANMCYLTYFFFCMPSHCFSYRVLTFTRSEMNQTRISHILLFFSLFLQKYAFLRVQRVVVFRLIMAFILVDSSKLKLSSSLHEEDTIGLKC